MKLTKLHLFLLIIVVLLLSTLGFSIKEYFETGEHDDDHENIATKPVTINVGTHTQGNNHHHHNLKDHNHDNDDDDKEKNHSRDDIKDLFSNNDIHDPLMDTDYSKTIAGLEDIVVPGRGSGKHHHDKDGNHWRDALNKKENKLEKKLEKEERRLAREAGVDMSKYILKSEIVPPVCPKCPDAKMCPREKPCNPCPPCARCPDPAFECKKVPNYSAITASNAGNILPMPRLNSFAQFN
jgi:hypothetical protein